MRLSVRKGLSPTGIGVLVALGPRVAPLAQIALWRVVVASPVDFIRSFQEA